MSKEGAPSPESLFDLRPEERLDDLERNGFKLIQKPSAFCFGMDAVLLSGFARVKKGERALDLCSGNGIVAILLAAKSESSRIDALELQPQMAEMACRSVKGNGLSDRVRFRQADVLEELPKKIARGETYELVILDPPAFTKSRSATKQAVKGYREINMRGMKLTENGGYLATCSCSHFMTRELLLKTVREAAKAARKRLILVEERAQSPDHPVLLQHQLLGGEGENSGYLKFFIFRVTEEA